MKCEYCGMELQAGDKFCRNCGSPLRERTDRSDYHNYRPQDGNAADDRTDGRGAEAAPSGEPVLNGGWTEQQREYQRRYAAGERPDRKFGGRFSARGSSAAAPDNSAANAGGGRGRGCRKVGCLIIIAIILIVMLAVGVVNRLVGGYGSYTNDYGSYPMDSGYNGSSTQNYGHGGWGSYSDWGSGSDGGWAGYSGSTSFNSYQDGYNGASGIEGVSLEGDFRDYYTHLRGDGSDSVTLMLYIVGSDLETELGSATDDLTEMLRAETGDIDLIVQTGGAKSWQNNKVDAKYSQRWRISNGQLTLLESSPAVNMAKPTSLSDFISYCAAHYPADRYGLILWDHGGGPVYGYGFDEQHYQESLLLSDIDFALDKAGIKFDFIGFDACLMATLETACVLENYADYLIASQQTEPSGGWYYTDWLSALAEDTGMDTVELGRLIVDDFIRHSGSSNTLSVTSLREIPRVYSCTDELLSAAAGLIPRSYNSVSAAIGKTTEFTSGYDLFDLGDLASELDMEGSSALIAALDSAVCYRNSCSVSDINGLSLYLPYSDLEVLDTALDIFDSIGYGDGIAEFCSSFATAQAYGQSSGGWFRSLNCALTGSDREGVDYTDCSWYDESVLHGSMQTIDYDELEVFWSEEQKWYYLPLKKSERDLLSSIQMQILADDGTGYVDLGSEDCYTMDDKGNLVLNYGDDCTWTAIDGRVVAFYSEGVLGCGEEQVYTGRVPALLNGDGEGGGTDIDLILQWDAAHPDGCIVGYRCVSEGNAASRGVQQFSVGDRVDFLFDCYDYDGYYDASYLLYDDPLIIGSELPAVSYEYVGDMTLIQCYLLTDIYNNRSWTESVAFYIEE